MVDFSLKEIGLGCAQRIRFFESVTFESVKHYHYNKNYNKGEFT